MAMNDRDPSIGDLFTPASAHGSPLHDFLTAFAPRKLKDLFRLSEYLYFNSSSIYAVLQRFATLPITDIVYNTTNEALKKRYETLHDKQLKTRRVLHRAAIDRQVYGNAFLSLYAPFIRFLRCPRCEHLTNIATVDYKFTLKKLQFTYTCSSCRAKVDGRVVDRKITRTDRISIIRWDPKLIDIDHNPITGHSEFYYSIPRELKERVAKGDPHLVNTLPIEFLKALRDDKIFKFAEGQIFHMKMDAPAGIEAYWGFPPLASAIKLFFYAATLRRANAAIAQDYVVPLRIISPKQSSANADPVMTISLDRWASEMKTNVRKWRRDPLHIMWSPVPAEVTHLGGQARALMTLGEVQDAEENIIAALGLPKEFIKGGFSAMGSGIQLRVLENQLLHNTGDLNDLLQWVTDKVARLLGWAPIEAELAPFRLIDDAQQKMVLLEINRSDPQGPWISKKTIGEAFEIDPVEEREQRKQEALDEVRYQQELQVAVTKLQNNLAVQVQAQAAMGQRGLAYDQQQVIAQADQMVEQLLQLDPGTRRSQLHGLEIEDLVLYSVVKKRLEDAQVAKNQAAVQQARASGGMDGMGGPPGGPAL